MNNSKWIGRNQSSKMTVEERFWEKVDRRGDDECWEWQANKDKDGYGFFWLNGKDVKAHRTSWEFSNGTIEGGLHVLHECDNPGFVNPNHLFLGTHQENMDDKNNKGRGGYLKGEQNPRSKFTRLQIADIRSRYAAGGVSMGSLAREFNVSHPTISYIVKRIGWNE